jgi:hypothetical protein
MRSIRRDEIRPGDVFASTYLEAHGSESYTGRPMVAV